MSMDYNQIYNGMTGAGAYGKKDSWGTSRTGERTAGRASNQANSVEERAKTANTTPVELSAKAQKLLEQLKKTYGNMDFMVADYKDQEEARSILSRGTKEFSVLFSSEELEKMASDEKYKQEKLNGMKGAVRMSEQINKQFGTASGFGKDSEKGEVTRVGMSFNKDGSVSYFAELEKSSNAQKDRTEAARAKRAQEKKEASKSQTPVKRASVQANSWKELVDKINQIDWDAIHEEAIEASGTRYDFSI